MRIGLFGGSFDPIHNAHLKLALAAIRQLNFDRLYFILSRSPFKTNKIQSSARARMRMVQLALKAKKKMKAVNWEIRRNSPSYTVDTLRWYKGRHPRHQLFFVMGSDVYQNFSRWKNPAEIRRLCTIVIGRRPGSRIRKNNQNHIVLKGIFPDVSSTEIRRFFLRGGSRHGKIPPSVNNYIRKHHLYS